MPATKKLSRTIIILVITTLVASCSAPTPIAPTLAPNTPTPLSTPTSLPTPVLTKVSATQTPTLQPTSIPQPTGMPLALDDPLQADIRNGKYKIVTSTSTVGPKGFIYSAYVLTDSSFKPERFGTNSFRIYNDQLSFLPNGTPTPSSELCRIAFYIWDGTKNFLMRSFRSGSSIMCSTLDWDGPNVFGYPMNKGEGKVLSLQGYWSDINQNGLPEFAMLYEFCANGCCNHGMIRTDFYEIQDTSTVTNITENIQGEIRPWGVLHANNPPTIRVYDSVYRCWFWPFSFFSVYQWDGTKFVNVTTNYKDEFMSYVESYRKEVQQQYGKPLDGNPVNLLYPLTIANKAQLPKEKVLEVFLDITDASHWNGTDQYGICWLQVARGSAKKEVAEDKNFSLRPGFLYVGIPRKYVEELRQTNYDVSACMDTMIFP